MNLEKNENAFASSMSADLETKSSDKLSFAQVELEVAQLIFDSVLQPVVKGVRGSAAVRQMLYKFTLPMQIIVTR